MNARFPYAVVAVDRAGVPWEILRSANPIDAFMVAEQRASRNLVTMVGHDDEEGWLDEDDAISAYLAGLTDEQVQRTLMIVRAQRGSVRDFAGLEGWLRSVGRFGSVDREECIEGIYDALYPRHESVYDRAERTLDYTPRDDVIDVLAAEGRRKS